MVAITTSVGSTAALEDNPQIGVLRKILQMKTQRKQPHLESSITVKFAILKRTATHVQIVHPNVSKTKKVMMMIMITIFD